MKISELDELNNRYLNNLTKGKWYDIMYSFPNYSQFYDIVNDSNQVKKYKKEYFLTIEEVRENKLNELGI